MQGLLAVTLCSQDHDCQIETGKILLKEEVSISVNKDVEFVFGKKQQFPARFRLGYLSPLV